MPLLSNRTTLALSCIPVILVGCAGGTGTPTSQTAPPPRAPLAVIAGQTVARSLLLERLAEAGGARVIEEIALDRAIKAELAERGLEPSPEALGVERERLIGLLSGGLDVDADSAVDLEDQIRSSRGLGPSRWNALLSRSAALRLLVQDQVDVSETAIRLAHQQRYGEQVTLRLLQASSQRDASRYRERVINSSEPGALFSMLAADHSIDAGARGGLLTVSLLDPRVPESIRRAAESLQTGTMSPVIATEGGYALVWLESRVPDSGTPLAEVRGELESLVRLRQERLLMEAEARALLASVSITVFDPSLAWAWDARSPGVAR